MTDADKPQFWKLLTLLAETWREPMNELRLEGYWVGLRDLSIEQLERACASAIQTLKFFPKPAELRDCAQGGGDDGAELAWQEYKHQAHRVGGYGSPRLEAALAETLTLVFGGWQQACWSDFTPEMWASKRKEFLRTYRLLKQRGVQGTQRMLGFHEEQNQARGFFADTGRKELPE